MIPLTKPYFREEEFKQIKAVLDSGWVAGQGPKNLELESKFKNYIGTKHAVCVCNCTAGLHLALLALKIGKKDEVIVPDFTYPATAHSVLYVGAKPMIVDIELETLNMDPKLIEEKITEKTKAIIVVHQFGNCVDMDRIMEIAKKHNLKVIEDCACAVGSTYKGKFAGSFGDVGVFSFHARKNITSGEGGMIVTDDEKIADCARSLACFGVESAYKRSSGFFIPKFTQLGYNYKMSDIAAGIAIAQLDRSELFIKRRNELALYYKDKLKNFKAIKTPSALPNSRHVFQTYCVLVEKDRDDIITNLKNKGIQTQIGTYSLHKQPIYADDGKYPNSSYAYAHGLALPMFHELTFEQIDNIVAALGAITK